MKTSKPLPRMNAHSLIQLEAKWEVKFDEMRIEEPISDRKIGIETTSARERLQYRHEIALQRLSRNRRDGDYCHGASVVCRAYERSAADRALGPGRKCAAR